MLLFERGLEFEFVNFIYIIFVWILVIWLNLVVRKIGFILGRFNEKWEVSLLGKGKNWYLGLLRSFWLMGLEF